MGHDIAAVCCYFNPCHYRSRLHNYLRFRDNIAISRVELLTVELAFGGDEFELVDVPNVLRVRATDVMWQKERLLNIGLAVLLRRGYSKLAWLDADITFDDAKTWAERTSALLDQFPLVQVYNRVIRQEDPERLPRAFPGSVAHLKATGVLSNWPGLTGFGWAARSDVFRSVSLYDAAILGGGDGLMFFAGYCGGHMSEWWSRMAGIAAVKALAPAALRHWMAWAKCWGAAIGGNIHYVPQGITALYHGIVQKRQYVSRLDILRRHAFDPTRDIACSAGGCWHWATNKPGLHAEARRYFRDRDEDM